MAKRPNADETEIEKVEKQLDDFNKQVSDLTLDRLNKAPVLENEQQTKISQRDLQKTKDIYLKPKRTISSREKFNERYREEYNFQKEYVQFIAENKEVIGESIELWIKPFPGCPAEEWVIPVNKPVFAPRYIAERIKSCTYHRLSMNEAKTVSESQEGTYFGQMVVDNTINRLDAIPVSGKRSIFMGAN